MVVSGPPLESIVEVIPSGKQPPGGLGSTRVARAIAAVEDALAAVLMAMIIVIEFLGVAARYLLSMPLQWSDEIALGLFVWLTFIGSAAAWRRHDHPGVDLLVDRLPRRARRVVWAVNYVVISIVLLGAIVLGWRLAISNLNSYTLNLELPRFYIDVAFVIGSALMTWHTVEHLERVWRGHLPVEGRRTSIP